MKHYHLRWSAAADDHPDWIACEVSDDGHVLRTVEHFAMGWADYCDATREEVQSLWDRPFNAEEIRQDGTLALHETTPEKFEALWAKSGD